MHTKAWWGACSESSVTVIALKQTEVFRLVLINVRQRQMQTHHSSQDSICPTGEEEEE